MSIEDALRVIDRWLSHPDAQVINPGEKHCGILARLLKAASATGNLTTDAHIAALGIEHDATVLSFDRDFARFEGLRWMLPEQ